MIINLFSSGAKILKIGTLFVATVLLLLILFVSFVAVFPSTFKDTVQEQLSTHSGFDIELSDISLGIEDGSVTVLFDKVGIFPQEKDIPVASVKDLQWNIDLSTLYDNIDISKFVSNFDMADMVDNIYRPNAVYIDNLIINDNYKYSRDVFGVKDIAKLFSSESLKVLYFIKSLRINKMQFQSKDNFDISTVNIERDNYQLLLTTYNQDLSFNNKFPALKQVDITATLATDQTDIKNYITVPVKISNGEADIYGNFRVISNREDDLIEYEGYIPTIEANQIPKYFSEELIGKDKYKQLSSTVFSGKLNNLKLNFSSRASKNGLIKSRLSTNIENVDISNNQVIESINDLNGSINTNFTDMRVILESAIVDGIRISDGEIRINNLGNPGSTLYVIANIDSKSEELIKFVRKMKVGDSIRNALDKFTLNGKVSGVSKLEMPLNGGKKNIEFDLNVTGNKLKTLGNDIVVEDFSSNIVYKDKRIGVNGDGYMDGFGKVNIQIPNSNFDKLSLNVIANIDSKSEELIKFVRKMKVGDSISNALDKFTLNGKVSGVSKLEMPLNGGKKNIEFDLNVTGNKLKTLGNDIVVEDFNSNIVYKDKRIGVNGNGYMDGFGKVNIQIPNSNFDKLSLNVIANIDSKSEELIKFVRKMKVGDSIRNALDKFTLNGKVSGVSKLEMPLNGGKKNIEFDLNVTGNKLKTLGNDIVVEDFSSNIVYKDNQVSTDGRGFFRGMHFDIDLNPNNYYEEEKYPLKLRLVNRTNGSEFHLRKYNDNLWLARIESESISGDIVVDLNNNEVPYIEINNLNILSVDSIGGDWDISSGDIPSMRIAVQGINIDDKVNAIPNFKANLISSNDTLLIKDLVFDGVGINNEESLSFNGAWLPSGQTSIMASAKGNRLSDFLSKLNIEEDVSGGEFDFDVRLFCNCSPWNMNFKDIKGIMHLRAKEGVFTDRGPSLGRILSLLNIQSISKRLQLDVSDVLQKGFAYDDIYAEILLEDSLAKIRKFDLNSTSSKIQLAGESNIVNKQYNIEAIVHPAISEAVPAATYIAGGGFIGLGIWLIDESIFDGKILDYIADKVIEVKYKISGPWSDPAIDFISFNELL